MCGAPCWWLPSWLARFLGSLLGSQCWWLPSWLARFFGSLLGSQFGMSINRPWRPFEDNPLLSTSRCSPRDDNNEQGSPRDDHDSKGCSPRDDDLPWWPPDNDRLLPTSQGPPQDDKWSNVCRGTTTCCGGPLTTPSFPRCDVCRGTLTTSDVCCRGGALNPSFRHYHGDSRHCGG
jgi:hypothetical protein